MHARRLLAIVTLGTLGLPLQLGAQARGSVGVQTGRPMSARPGPRPSQPTIHRPPGTIATVGPFSGARDHRPIHFRSSILGLVVFDPYWWLAPDFDIETLAEPAMAPPGPRLSGGLQLDVEPRRAFVYIDGVLVGTVDQFKGYFQHLETSAGYHVVEFVSPDYEPLTTGVTVVPNKTTTYRAFLNRR